MRLSLYVVIAALLLPAFAQAGSTAKVPAQAAYNEVIGWGLGYSSSKDINRNKTRIGDADQRLERAAYRYGVVREFAMAVVATEAYFYPQVSYARSESWKVYEQATKYKLPQHPEVMNDLDTALSTLVDAMQKGKTVDQVLTLYWCGPGKSMNTASLAQFTEYVNKLYNGLEPYARERLQAERSGRVKPSSSDYSEFFDDDYSGWGGGKAVANKDGFKSKLGTRPLKQSEMVYFKGYEEDYAAQIKTFNKSIGDSQARLIARAILNYCHKTNWEVDPRFVMALVAAESRFRTNAVSSAGALGLGQLMPATARSFGVSNAFDPVQNLYGCVKYIEREQHRWGKSKNKHDLILASYNAGPGAVKKYGGVPPYRETQGYVKTVKKYYKRFCT